MIVRFITCLALAGLLSGCAHIAPDPMSRAEFANYATRMIGPPPPALHLDPFYTKYADADGIPIVGSARAPDTALLAARDIVNSMLVIRPDIRAALVAQGGRVGVMAIDETTTDMPEQRDWKKPAIDDPRLSKCDVRDYATTIGRMSDRDYWAARARGMGGLYTTSAAENLMAVPGTRYYGENILVHEFSHNIMGTLDTVDPALRAKIDAAYANAKAQGLWRGAYMALTVEEYWAEGTQFWFNSNKVYRTDGITIASSDDLAAHDPQLFDALKAVYGENHHIAADAFYMHPARYNSPKADLKNDCFS